MYVAENMQTVFMELKTKKKKIIKNRNNSKD